MKTIKTLFFIGFLITISPNVISQNWGLVWQDEFNNNISSDWVFETGNGASGWGNNELQYYRRENATVENGNLVITAKKENFGGYRYTSARMKTQGKRRFKYGKIEAKIALPLGQGLWPAFWMLGSNISSVGWPACGEIDIMEHINNSPDVHGTIHWQDGNGNYASYGGDTAVNVSNYHVYTIEWDENEIKWFIDGRQYHIVDISNGVNGTSEFHNDYFLLLNLAVGGNWPGFSVDDSKFPARMYVDYVRVYQKESSPPNPTTGDVTLYIDCNYQGFSRGLSVGSYTKSQLQALGISNDNVSSLRIKSGFKATLYWDDNFTGNSLVKTADDSCLTNDGNWNDNLTSIIVSKIGNGGYSQLIEAENYTSMSGVQKENCSEGGQNVGYIDTADWMAYNAIDFPTSGNYRIEYRVASAVSAARLSTDINAGATVLGQLTIPNTGGWQNWTTVSHVVSVNQGTYPLGIYAVSGGFNVNWIKMSKEDNALSFNTALVDDLKLDKEENNLSTTSIFPNPFTDVVQLDFDKSTANIIIHDGLGHTVFTSKIIESGKSINLSHLKKGIYLITIEKDGITETKRIIKK